MHIEQSERRDSWYLWSILRVSRREVVREFSLKKVRDEYQKLN